MDNKIVKGVYSAFVSPVDGNGHIRGDVVCKLMDWQSCRFVSFIK